MFISYCAENSSFELMPFRAIVCVHVTKDSDTHQCIMRGMVSVPVDGTYNGFALATSIDVFLNHQHSDPDICIVQPMRRFSLSTN